MKNLRKLRKSHNLSLKEFGALFGLAESTISLYELGKREPDIATLKNIASYFNITVDELLGMERSNLSNAEDRETIREVHDLSMINFEKMCDNLDEVTLGRIHSILISLRKIQDNPVLSIQDKQLLFESVCAIIGRIEIYMDEIRYAPENANFDHSRHNKRFINAEVDAIKEIVNIMLPSPKTNGQKGIVIPFYETPVSAGVGSWLSDDTPTEWITLPRNDETESADMILEVRGDSMQPRFYDSDKVLVKSSESIMEGEIGVFVLNVESYIKKMGKGCLISLNSAYDPIKIGRFDDIHCVGKVIDKVKMN